MKKKTTVSSVMASPLGSWLKAFLSVVLSLYLVDLSQGRDLFDWDILLVKKLVTAGVVSLLPNLINWLNPQYTYNNQK